MAIDGICSRGSERIYTGGCLIHRGELSDPTFQVGRAGDSTGNDH